MLLWFPTFCFGSGGLQTFIDAYGFADDKVYIWGGIAFIFVEFVLCAWYVVFILPGTWHVCRFLWTHSCLVWSP